MNVREQPEAVAGAMAEAARGLGFETGIQLALLLVYLRYRTLSAPDLRGRAQWRRLQSLKPRGLDVALDAMLDSSDDLWPSRLALQRTREDGGRALRSMLNALDHLPDRGEDGGDREVREVHRDVFERLLDVQVRESARTASEYRTPRWLAQLIIDVSRQPLGRTIDPACGFGEVLLQAGRSESASELWGWDISEEAAAVCRMRLDLAGVSAKIRRTDALREARERRFDSVVVQPPWGMTLRDEELPWAQYGRSKGYLDLAWAQRAVSLLDSRGRAVVHVPAAALWRDGADAAVRVGMLRDGVIEAIVLLPEGIAFGTRAKSALLVLRSLEQTDASSASTLLIDASDLGVLASRSNVQLRTVDIQRIADSIRDWRALAPRQKETYARPGLAKSVLAKDLAEAGARLDPHRHVPPATRHPVRFRDASGRLLKELRLENFKSFGRSQAIPLAPITLLYGPNAAGKSSIIQALVLLRESLSAGKLVPQGHANLGSFEGLIHRHDRALPLGIGVSFRSPLRDADPRGMASPGALRSADFRFAADAGGRARQTQVQLGFDDVHLAFPRQAESSTEGDCFLAATGDVNKLLAALHDGLLFGARSGSPTTPEEDERERGRAAQRISEAQRAMGRAFAGGVRFTHNGLLPGRISTDQQMSGEVQHDRDPTAAALYSHLTDVERVIGSVATELGAILGDMAWLGPVRSPPERFYARSERERSIGLGARGENVAIYLFDNQTDVVLLNEWFRKLEIPYELRVVPVFAGDRTPTVGELVALVLRDRRLDVDTSPADVGFGISQILPIVVQLLASQEQVIAMEQPEIHLHPRLQAEMADLLIASTDAGERANQVIVETHSEHLVLRLQRRIREGVLSPEDLSVVYVDLRQGDQQARALRLRLDGHGYFLDEWPQGFFDERLAELFEGDE